ncbi:beta-lactamase domain protein [Methanococcus vannielii SB]|uniref:Beta-lactamase domain protein n=1 Tax=Methanococcus vannielii (strain ATCC 35089 / DSM 1224 / JCM 13029 / OCM 148 / SB) TaxID=406327 RepID=A6US40_METVS|nr:MBL fold metallo-hydrolase [Methanococcus vannielii]ABR55312.1 beta-lactamase domain protein [Methanococcus vannielii SB]
MELYFRGGAFEVGRSCVEVKSDKSTVLFDCGVKLSPKGIEYPILDDLNADCVFPSHSHLDHVGSIPVLIRKGMVPAIYATPITKAITKELLRDSLKISQVEGHELPYDKEDFNTSLSLFRKAGYNKPKKFKDFEFELFNAGHIPGSSTILLNYGSKKIVYTGDVKVNDTELVKGADLSYSKENIDCLIIESTYGGNNQEDRKEAEKKFVEEIKKTVERGGVALIPVFAVDRSQEIIMMLNKYDFKVPVYFDGLGRKITRIMLDYPEYLNYPHELKDAFFKVIEVNPKDRKQIIKDLKNNGGIVVSTAGMLEGGPIIPYIFEFMKDKKSSLIFTGYQVEDTAGRYLLETGKVKMGELDVTPEFEVMAFQFSAHGEMGELRHIVKKVNPETLIIQHGEASSLESFKNWAVLEGFSENKVFTPKVGDKINLNEILR